VTINAVDFMNMIDSGLSIRIGLALNRVKDDEDWRSALSDSEIMDRACVETEAISLTFEL